MTSELRLPSGHIVLCDDADHEWLSQYSWIFRPGTDGKGGYARRWIRIGPGRIGRHVRMHREIMDAKPGESVDHIDHNGLNNQRSNLRICTFAQNSHNEGPRKGTSIYKGVCWCKASKKWIAHIRANGVVYRLGSYANEIDAAIAYDQASLKYHGDFGYRNFDTDRTANAELASIVTASEL